MWQEYQAAGLQVIGISNEPISVIQDFVEDQGITFPVLHDDQSVYSAYNLPGAASPYPRDFILDVSGVVRLAKHEYEPGTMITVIESLLQGSTAVIESHPSPNPHSPVLLSTYPNPFNPDALVSISLNVEQNVTLSVLDIRGRLVQELMRNERLPSGQHQIRLDGERLSSGVFFVLLETGQERQIKKIVKLR